MPKRPVKEAEKLMRQAYALFESGFSREDIAKSMNVSLRTVHRWIQRAEQKKVVEIHRFLEVTGAKPTSEPALEHLSSNLLTRSKDSSSENQNQEELCIESLATQIMAQSLRYEYPENDCWQERRENIREQQYGAGSRLLDLALKSLARAEYEQDLIPTKMLPKSIETAIALLRQASRLDIVEKYSEPDQAIAQLSRSGYAIVLKNETLEKWSRLVSSLLTQMQPDLSPEQFEALKIRFFGSVLQSDSTSKEGLTEEAANQIRSKILGID